MAFTKVTVTHTFQNGDGTAASGNLTFVLTGRMTNSGTTIIPTPVQATLDGTGSFSVSLAANDDAGTTPGIEWQVTTRILGGPEETYTITVPGADAPTVDLGQLIPSGAQVG
jgi:hypothetical protein